MGLNYEYSSAAWGWCIHDKKCLHFHVANLNHSARGGGIFPCTTTPTKNCILLYRCCVSQKESCYGHNTYRGWKRTFSWVKENRVDNSASIEKWWKVTRSICKANDCGAVILMLRSINGSQTVGLWIISGSWPNFSGLWNLHDILGYVHQGLNNLLLRGGGALLPKDHYSHRGLRGW